ncbi:MAG: hypothetical protein M1820_009036 [Bogoriella megaspora]|nr:MAG: hypothetical protein M1820_009036 [Bogoriella megaspora]
MHCQFENLFRIRDRKDVGYLLSPTHEEEITELVGNTIKSYRDLPLRLYQIGRKYRDELRPRQGLLRTKEFLMKDLYTFDSTPQAAVQTYEEVRQAYGNFFTDLQVPHVVAEADSGNMGGNKSHEYHFITANGEDNIVSCTNCGYTANEEIAEKVGEFPPRVVDESDDLKYWIGISSDRRTLYGVFYIATGSKECKTSEITRNAAHPLNLRALSQIIPELDLSVENAEKLWRKNNSYEEDNGDSICYVYDARLGPKLKEMLRSPKKHFKENPLPKVLLSKGAKKREVSAITPSGQPVDLIGIQDGDRCQRCSHDTLTVRRGIEIGHTFYLGTRYSKPLDVTVTLPAPTNATEGQNTVSSMTAELEMGCHGIGISRLIGAVAATLSDDVGLRWPRAIAPFDVVIMSGKEMDSHDTDRIYELLGQCDLTALTTAGARILGSERLDLVIDDRPRNFGWKLKDAEMIGYPIIVLLGRAWVTERKAEVHCPRIGFKEFVLESDLVKVVAETLQEYMRKGLTSVRATDRYDQLRSMP